MKLRNTQFSLGFSYFLPLGQNSIPTINIPLFFPLMLRDQDSHSYKTDKNLNFVVHDIMKQNHNVIFQGMLSWLTCFILLEAQAERGVEGGEDEDKYVTWCKQRLLHFNGFVRKLLP